MKITFTGLLCTLFIVLTTAARAQGQTSSAADTAVKNIKLTAAPDIADASTVNEAISVMVKDAYSCDSSTSKDAQACTCSFKDDLKKLNSSYAAAVAKHPGWNEPNTVVLYVDGSNGKSVVISFPNVKRQLDACARRQAAP